jgi:hypothetical protein
MADASAMGDRKLKIFISYSRKDEEFAQDLLAGLRVAGFEPYLDKHDIAAGEDWEARLGLRPLKVGGPVHVGARKRHGRGWSTPLQLRRCRYLSVLSARRIVLLGRNGPAWRRHFGVIFSRGLCLPTTAEVPQRADGIVAVPKSSCRNVHALAGPARGTIRPRALAVLRLITNSTFTDCCKGRSAPASISESIKLNPKPAREPPKAQVTGM